MKKIAIVAFFILLCPTISAQDYFKSTIGAKAGLNLANIGGEETDNAINVVPHFGAYAEFYFYHDWDLQAELLFSWQGHAPKTDIDNRLTLLYFNLPLVWRYFPVENVNIHLGPQPGFLLSAKSKAEDTKQDVKDFFKGFDLGLVVGGGYDFNIYDRPVNVNLRYVHGLLNIADGGQKRYNRVFQISLGVMILELKN